MKELDIENMSQQEFDAAFVDALESAPNGPQEKAAAVYSKVVRRRIRESGVQRLVLPFETIGNERLTKLPTTDLPAVVEDMEPESRGAKTIPFSDTPDTAFYRGDKFIVLFCKITTPWYTKNIDELRTDTSGLRQMVADNSLRDIPTEEDNRFFALVDRITGSASGAASTSTGLVQYERFPSLDRANYNESLSLLEDRYLNNGVFVTNRRTAKWVNALDAMDVGAEIAGATIKKGLKGFASDKLEFFGVPHIASIKTHLFPNNVVYQFADVNFLGKAYMLQNIRMFVEKKLDILRWCSQEKVGVTIANAAAVQKVIFAATA